MAYMSTEERDACVALFLEGKTTIEIAATYKRHPRTIEKLLTSRGVRRQKHSYGREPVVEKNEEAA